MPLILKSLYDTKKELSITLVYMYKVINDFYNKLEKSEKYMNENKKTKLSESINKKLHQEITIDRIKLITYFVLALVSLTMFIVSIISYEIMTLSEILMIINIILGLVVIVMIITLTKNN